MTDPQEPSPPPLRPAVQPPCAQPSYQSQGDATGGLIPYKNPPALIAYYLAVFSLLPCIGIFLGIPAVILGIIGLKQHAKNPILKGAAHAWVGIILGGLMTLLWGAGIAISIVGILNAR